MAKTRVNVDRGYWLTEAEAREVVRFMREIDNDAPGGASLWPSLLTICEKIEKRLEETSR